MDKNVYVIDGDAAIRDGLSTLGELLGVEVHCYSSAEEFLNQAGIPQELPGTDACIICAQELNGMNGLSLFKKLQQDELSLPFALVTSSRSALIRTRARRAGVDQLVKKPQADKALIEFIEQTTGATQGSPHRQEH